MEQFAADFLPNVVKYPLYVVFLLAFLFLILYWGIYAVKKLFDTQDELVKANNEIIKVQKDSGAIAREENNKTRSLIDQFSIALNNNTCMMEMSIKASEKQAEQAQKQVEMSFNILKEFAVHSQQARSIQHDIHVLQDDFKAMQANVLTREEFEAWRKDK